MAAEHSNALRAGSPWRDPWVWAVFVLALAVRLAYLVDLRHLPFFAHPQMDALYHDRWARGLAAGNWVGEGVFFRAPLYPYFLGLLYALFGPDYLLVRVVQFTLGAGTALLTAALSYPRFGRGAAVTAGLLVALYGPLIYFEGELLLVVLEAPLYLLTAWSLDRALRRRTTGTWVTAGALAALAALVRPIVLAVLPVAAVYLLLRERRRAWRPLLLYGASALLVLSPVLVRNWVVGRDLVPVASQGGLNYYLGNNPHADGMAAVAPEFRRTWEGQIADSNRLAELAEGRTLKPSGISRYWYRRAFSWAVHDPGAFLTLQLHKLGYFWDAFEIPNNQDYYFFSQLTRIYRTPFLIGFGLLGPLALAGLVTGWYRRLLPFAWIAVPLTLMAVIVGFFVCSRFRTSLAPLLAVWAGAGLVGAIRLISRGRRLMFLLYAAVLIAAGWGLNADLFGLRAHRNSAESNLRLGIFYASRGERAQALAYYKTALMVDPGFAEAWNNLGVVEAEAGRLDVARQAFEGALQAEPAHPRALGNLAALDFREGRRAEADSLARRTLEVAGTVPEAIYNASVVLGNLGELDAAEAGFDRLVLLDPGNAAARLGQARARLARGDRDGARRSLLDLPPEKRTPEIQALLKEVGRP